MRITIKVHDELKGTEGWSHMFITLNGITRLDELEEAEVHVSMDENRTIKIQQNVHFNKIKPQILYKQEGKVQTVKYEGTLSLNKLKPVQINSYSSGNFGNDGSSVLSENDSSSVTRSATSANYRQVKLDGQFVKSYHIRGHPFRYYKRGDENRVFYQKKKCLKLKEIRENDPDLYSKLINVAAGNGVNVDELPSDEFGKFAEKVFKGSPMKIVKNGDGIQVTSPATETSESPRSPVYDPNMSYEISEQAWAT